MSNILISLTHTISLAMGKLVINENCCLCKRVQKDEEVCIRDEDTDKILCKSCIKRISNINLRTIITNPDQLDIKF